MKLMSVGLAALVAIAAFSGATASPVKLKIDSGVIVGDVWNGVRTFKGVPFAKAPVGDLRWVPPQRISWTGERDATQFALPCPQPLNANGTANGGGVVGPVSEDCLYLNVFAPANARKAPVMVYLYGGAGYLGAGHLGSFQGTSFARDGVILVTINYRLGALGNFAHPALTAAARPGEPAGGSFAMMDSIAALQWVQRNIALIGGDPNNVTLFGQSAGGSLVSTLLSSPMAKGLFHKAIVHSGVNLGGGQTLAAAEQAGSRIATTLGLPGPNATLAQLRAIPYSRFVDNTEIRAGVNGVLDGKVRTTSTRDGFTSGATVDVPLMVGSNSGEGGFTGARDMVNLAQGGAASYQYYFTYVPAWRTKDQPNGAIHSAELPYVFDALDTSSMGGGRMVTDVDRDMARRIHSCWVAFAKSAVTDKSLTCSNGFVWPARTAANDAVGVFGDLTQLKTSAAIVATLPPPAPARAATPTPAAR